MAKSLVFAKARTGKQSIRQKRPVNGEKNEARIDLHVYACPGWLCHGNGNAKHPEIGLAAEPASCSTVRFSDVGWTDITSTTAVATEILKGLGYTTDIKVLSVPVTYASLAKRTSTSSLATGTHP